jgi:hypothetical protein
MSTGPKDGMTATGSCIVTATCLRWLPSMVIKVGINTEHVTAAVICPRLCGQVD